MKYFFYLLLLFCLSCKDQSPSPAIESCARLDKIFKDSPRDTAAIDAIVRQAGSFSPEERYAVTLNTIIHYLKRERYEIADQYLNRLDTTTSLRTKDKSLRFLFLDLYANAKNLQIFAPRYINTHHLSFLLFDMENRQKLTPSEKCRFLTLKATIFAYIYQESEAALSILSEAIGLVRQHHITGEPLREIYTTLGNCCSTIGNREPFIAFSRELLDFTEKDLPDSMDKKKLYLILSTSYYNQQDYSQSWYWLKKSGKDTTHLGTTFRVLFHLDSIPTTLAYLEKIQPGPTNDPEIHSVRKNWYKALIYLKAGDTAAYESHLTKSVRIFEQHPRYISGDVSNAIFEAYARMLWKQGKREEAIRRMETASGNIIRNQSLFNTQSYINLKIMEELLQRLQLLTDFYAQAGRPVDALRQARLCDSLKNLYSQAQIKLEQRKTTNRTYIANLQRNLDQRSAELLREQQKQYIMALLLGIAVLVICTLILFYYHHKKQLHILYARQKEIEHLQEENQKHPQPDTPELSPEERLFRQLEKQFYREQLFRNPDFSRDDLCRLGGSNRMYISTCINKYTGGNINQWINQARVDYAIQLIRTGETNLQVIAENAGFASTTSFFRNFKQFTHLTPKQYIQHEK